MILTRGKLEKKSYNIRSYKDRRKKVDKYVFSYFDRDGIEYRRGFEFSVNTSMDDVYAKVPNIIN